MPNIGTLLKTEIARIARKELRAETEALKKSNAAYRGQIAELRRKMQALEQQMKRLGKAGPQRGRAVAEAEEEDDGPKVRFSAKSLASQRKRLGLSAASVAKLLGVSALSVYKWESGNTRPRAKQIQAIAGLRKLGRREVAKRLAGETEGAAAEEAAEA